MDIRWLLWAMMFVQVVGWLWGITYKAGDLTDRQYILWCIFMLSGQTGAALDCFFGKVYGAMALQVFFIVSTLIGGIKRYCQMRSKEAKA